MTEKKAVYHSKAEIKIGAKNLAALALPNACPQCFWIKQKVKSLPYQIFPGIFSSIDSYSKKIIHASIDHYKRAPTWLPELQDVVAYSKIPHWSKFKRTDTKTGITVSGVVDDLLLNANGSLVIPDYKTAKFTANADKLFPLYVAQLNTYAWIQSSLSSQVIDSLWLIYFEPVTDLPVNPVKPSEKPSLIKKFTVRGFDMGFNAHTLAVNQDSGLVDDLLAKAKVILDQPEPPDGLAGCKDCKNLDRLKDMCGWM